MIKIQRLVFTAFLVVILTNAAFSQDMKMESTTFDFALYFAPEPRVDVEATLRKLLTERYVQFFDSSDNVTSNITKIAHHWVEIDQYAPPSPDAFRYTAKDLSMEMGAAIAKSKKVFILSFTALKKDLLPANQHACALIADLAEEAEGIPWDEECRLLYSTAKWRKDRLETWSNGIPDVRAHVTMHAYRNPELVRVITLGMRKFGLPDLVMDEIPSGNSRSAGHTINACAQMFLEGNWPKGGKLELDLSRIRHPGMRAEALENPGDGATGKVEIAFRLEKPTEGDPKNLLWRLEFRSMKGATTTEQQAMAFSTLFGATDKITPIQTGDSAIHEASKRARSAFFAKESSFRQGLQPDERLDLMHAN